MGKVSYTSPCRQRQGGAGNTPVMPWRIIVADDDPEICTLIKTILRGSLYEVIVCSDAESVLVRLKRDQPYDLVVSDFMLPGLSGIELVTMIRANPSTANVPILMISGHSNYAMDARSKGAGADHFLNKPFTVSQLRTTVNTLAGRFRPLPPEELAAAQASGASANKTSF